MDRIIKNNFSSNICFDRVYLIMLVLAIALVGIYNQYRMNKKTQMLENKYLQCVLSPLTIKSQNNLQQPDVNIVINNTDNDTHEHEHNHIYDHKHKLNKDLLRKYDKRALKDALTPPLKRDDSNISPIILRHAMPDLVPIQTKGHSTTFKKIGYLTSATSDNNDQYKFLILFGRQKYKNSTQYEYYASSNSKENYIKFDLDKYKKEINTDDIIAIPQLGNYTATVDRNLDLNYDPFA